MAEAWAVQMVSDELERASDVSETRDREALQALGIGAGDLAAALDELLEGGTVEEEAPGQFRHVSDEMRGGPPAAVAEEPEPEPEPVAAAPAEPEADAPEEDDGGATAVGLARMVQGSSASPLPFIFRDSARTLVLSRPMIQAMDPVQLGAMILAAVNAEAERSIMLRIDP